jgi:hypothetical protein
VKVEKERIGYHGNQSNVKKTRTFFSKSEDKEIRISKESIIALGMCNQTT